MSHRLSLNPVVRYYLTRIRQYPKLVLGVLAIIPATILINGYLPTLIVATVLNKLTTRQHEVGQLVSTFLPYLVLYAVFMIAGLFMWKIVDWFMWHLEGNVSRDIAEQVFDHMMLETADFHANHFTGSLISHTNKLMGGYIRAADTTVFQVYPMVAGITIVAIVMSTRAPIFVALFLAFAITFIVVALRISKPVQRQGAIFANIESKQTGYLADAVTNALAIKSFARGDYERRRFHTATMRTYDSLFIFANLHRRQMNWLGGLTRSISAMSLTVAVVSVLAFKVNIGTAFLILSYTANIVEQLFQFGNSSLRNYNRSLGDGSDMVKILSQTPKILDPIEPEKSKMLRGEVEFADVSFTHNGATNAIFEGLNIHIKAGEHVGLVGHSGSGKTTLTRLLLRFSDVNAGSVLIDGQNIANVTQDDLHSKIAYVPQEPILFHRTLKENIGYGDTKAGDKAINAVAKVAHADEFITALPDGYSTLVGERGVKLSGGQRQRIAIARAMLKNAPILVLDEATSALDSESEALIQDALWKLMEGRTAIVVAHRLSTIQRMDRIIVMDDGKVIEQGTHKELLELGGQYAQLWQRQSGGFIQES